MKLITIVVPDDAAEPPCVYIGDMDPLAASMACWQAHTSLVEELPGMTVDRSKADWQS